MVNLVYPKSKRKKTSKVQEWNTARKRLKEEYKKRGIVSCEVGLDGCWKGNALSFAHRYKRRDPRCTHDYKGTILCCILCHQRLEVSRELTEEWFERLRS